MSEQQRKPTPEQEKTVQETWSRYRRFIIGLTGIHGEILAAHLTVEGELENGIRRLMPHPDAVLDGIGFMQKLRLLTGLWPGLEPLGGRRIEAIKHLNKIRNMIAHGDAEDVLNVEIGKLLTAASKESGRPIASLEEQANVLRGMVMGISGFLAGATEGQAFEGLRQLKVKRPLAP